MVSTAELPIVSRDAALGFWPDSRHTPHGSERPAEPAYPNALMPGDRIGAKYVIVRVLGEGASAFVYEAEHIVLRNHVAVKVAHARDDIEQEAVRHRFRREASICARIRSPHVPRVYDVGVLANGAPFMVMELLQGVTLDAYMAHEQLPLPIALEIARQILLALRAVHDEGAVHRDVKPENLILHDDGRGEGLVVQLVDFGISKLVEREPDDLAITRERTLLGTPYYMAPEQIRCETLDARADIYALGAVLYEMITSRPPFLGDDVAELTAAALRDPIIPPSVLRQDCPPVLERLVLTALSRNREQRFASAEAMLTALERVAAWESYATGFRAWEAARPPRTPRARHAQITATTQRVLVARVVQQPTPWPDELPVKRTGTALAISMLVALMPLMSQGHAPRPQAAPSPPTTITTERPTAASAPRDVPESRASLAAGMLVIPSPAALEAPLSSTVAPPSSDDIAPAPAAKSLRPASRARSHRRSRRSAALPTMSGAQHAPVDLMEPWPDDRSARGRVGISMAP